MRYLQTKHIRSFLRYFLISLMIFLSLIGIYFISALLFSSIGTSPGELNCKKSENIYLSSNDVHVDLIFPIEQLDTAFIALLSPIYGAKYVAFGWGDRGFYLETPTWEDLRYSTVLKALLWFSPAVMHVSFYSNQHATWTAISVCPEQIKLMETEILKSFQLENSMPWRISGYDYGPNDRFFEAEGSYNCFYTCNVWTGCILKKGKMKTAVWSPFTGGIMNFAK